MGGGDEMGVGGGGKAERVVSAGFASGPGNQWFEVWQKREDM